MNKALILGISGQDGSLLGKYLLSKGYEVHGTSRDAQLTSFQNLKTLGVDKDIVFHSLNTHDFRSLISTLQKIKPTEIYHLSGQSSVGLSFDQPVETFESIAISTLNILEAVRFLHLETRIYFAGSSECFGETPKSGANETTPFNPRSPYATAKATSYWQTSNYREAYKLYACTGILFNHESPFRPNRFVTKKIIRGALDISRGKSNKLQLGNLSISRDWGWAEEYVQAMWLMLQAKIPQDYVISTGQTNSLEKFVEYTFETLGLNWKDYVTVDESFLRPTDLQYSKGDPSKAHKDLGWKSTKNLEQIVQSLLEWETKL